MIKKIGRLLAWSLGIGVIVGLNSAALIAPAMATGSNTVVPRYAACANAGQIDDWYGHDDEGALFGGVKSTEAGLRFSGPSLIHHQFGPLGLADVAKHADLNVNVTTGVAPLVKFRALNPFTTFNIDADGKWWASGINPSDPGGISNPLSGPADFIGKELTKTAAVGDVFTVDTYLDEIQIGYASDPGNTSIVVSLTHQGVTYPFACPEPVVTPTTPPATTNPTTPPATNQPTGNPTVGPTEDPTTPEPTGEPTIGPGPGTRPGGGQLALTGSDTNGVNPLAILLPLAAVLVLGGTGAVLVTRERRKGAHRA